jgi:hypothetical protein
MAPLCGDADVLEIVCGCVPRVQPREPAARVHAGLLAIIFAPAEAEPSS